MGVARELAELGSAYNSGGINQFRNRIINGGMMIDQRNNGATVAFSASTGASSYLTDRFIARSNVTSATGTFSQSNVTPSGFKNSLAVQVTTGAASGVGEVAYISQRIEGNNVFDLAWGTASAAAITLSFWVRSSLTGTFGGAVQNSAGNRSYPFTFAISAANTWQQKSVTIAGDTSGTWLTDNGIGLILYINLGSGTNFQGTAGAWVAADDRSATGATQVTATSGATFYITGVQLEKGSTATSFDYRPYGTELALCQRYYEKSYNADVVPGASSQGGSAQYQSCSSGADQYAGTWLTFKQTKRATPTMAYFAPGGSSAQWSFERSGSSGTNTAINGGVLGHQGALAYVLIGAAWVVCNISGHWTASAEL